MEKLKFEERNLPRNRDDLAFLNAMVQEVNDKIILLALKVDELVDYVNNGGKEVEKPKAPEPVVEEKAPEPAEPAEPKDTKKRAASKKTDETPEAENSTDSEGDTDTDVGNDKE